MKIAVCDDCFLDRKLLCEWISYYFCGKSYNYEISEFEFGTHLLYEIQDGEFYDIIFLDIFMDDNLGIDIARKLREQNYNGIIIFSTATDEFAVESYDVNASGYLIKPHSVEKIAGSLDRVLKNFKNDMFNVKNGRKYERIGYSEITYIESDNSKCILHGSDGRKHIIYKKLSEIEEQLTDRRFLRCHQSFIVNMDFVKSIEKQFELVTGEFVLIRQKDIKVIRNQYLDYIKMFCISG